MLRLLLILLLMMVQSYVTRRPKQKRISTTTVATHTATKVSQPSNHGTIITHASACINVLHQPVAVLLTVPLQVLNQPVSNLLPKNDKPVVVALGR